MKVKFDIKNANIFAFLTSSTRNPPRVKKDQLVNFLDGMKRAADDKDKAILVSADSSSLDDFSKSISITQGALENELSNGKNIEDIPDQSASSDKVQDLSQPDTQYIESGYLRGVLLALTNYFYNYKFFGLLVGKEVKELSEFAKLIANNSSDKAFIVLPDNLEMQETVSFLDPMSPIALLGNETLDFPGVLFWTQTGSASFAPLKNGKAHKMYEELVKTESRQEADNILDRNLPEPNTKKILHLSDLNFGQTAASKNKIQLKKELKKRTANGATEKVVITGGVFNEPDERAIFEFEDFRVTLEDYSGQEVVMIPGSSDRHYLTNGLLGVEYDPPVSINLDWDHVEVADEIQCVLVCFDSSEGEDAESGHISNQQLVNIEAALNKIDSGHPDTKNYSRIALIHHLADKVLEWCAKREIPLILHGHSEIQSTDTVNVKVDDKDFMIRTVACGTSLGADGKPAAYNVLSWDSVTNNWNVIFFDDNGDGKDFFQRNVTIRF